MNQKRTTSISPLICHAYMGDKQCNGKEDDSLSPCCGEEVYVSKTIWGWMCNTCKDSYDELDRVTDWDKFEADKRARIFEEQEY